MKVFSALIKLQLATAFIAVGIIGAVVVAISSFLLEHGPAPHAPHVAMIGYGCLFIVTGVLFVLGLYSCVTNRPRQLVAMTQLAIWLVGLTFWVPIWVLMMPAKGIDQSWGGVVILVYGVPATIFLVFTTIGLVVMAWTLKNGNATE